MKKFPNTSQKKPLLNNVLLLLMNTGDNVFTVGVQEKRVALAARAFGTFTFVQHWPPYLRKAPFCKF